MRLRGELDLAGVATLGAVLQRLREGRQAVLLDLNELEFIDMSGLRVVVAAAQAATQDGRRFTITAGSRQVRRLISLVQLDGQLPLERSLR